MPTPVIQISSLTRRFGEKNAVDRRSDLARAHRVLTETPSLDERLTARDNLTIYADLYDVPRAEVAGRVNSLLFSRSFESRNVAAGQICLTKLCTSLE